MTTNFLHYLTISMKLVPTLRRHHVRISRVKLLCNMVKFEIVVGTLVISKNKKYAMLTSKVHNFNTQNFDLSALSCRPTFFIYTQKSFHFFHSR